MANVSFDTLSFFDTPFPVMDAIPREARVVRWSFLKDEDCKGLNRYYHRDERGGWFVGPVGFEYESYDGDLCWERCGYAVISWVEGGRKKRMKRLNRLFREARGYAIFSR